MSTVSKLSAMALAVALFLPLRVTTIPSLAAADDVSIGASIDSLVELLSSRDPAKRRRAATELGEHGRAATMAVRPLTRALDDPDATVRCAAIRALGLIGPACRGSIPKLITMMGDEQYFAKAADSGFLTLDPAANALGRIGDASVSALAGALRDPDVDKRCLAAMALGQIGPPAASAVPELIARVSEKGDDALPVRLYAAEALGQIGPAARSAAPALLEALKDEGSDDYHAREYVQALARIGAPPLKELREAISAKDDEAIFQLGKMGPAAAPATPDLIKALNDESLESVAATVLGKIGPAAAEAVPALIDTLKRPRDPVAVWSIEALGRIGPAAKPAAPILVRELNRAGNPDAETIARALVRIDPDGVDSVPALLGLLGHMTPRDPKAIVEMDDPRVPIIELLGMLGPVAAGGVPALSEALRDESIAADAADALRLIGPPARAAVPALIDALKSSDDRLSALAAEVLGRIGTASRVAVPTLLEKLKNGDQITPEIPKALLRIDPGTKTVVEPMLPSIWERVPHQGALIAAALGRTFPQGEVRARLALEGAEYWHRPEAQLDDADWPAALRDYLETLGDLGTNARLAVPYLETLCKDPNAFVRRWANDALRRIDGRPTP